LKSEIDVKMPHCWSFECVCGFSKLFINMPLQKEFSGSKDNDKEMEIQITLIFIGTHCMHA
jgi:hypothetical protein